MRFSQQKGKVWAGLQVYKVAGFDQKMYVGVLNIKIFSIRVITSCGIWKALILT